MQLPTKAALAVSPRLPCKCLAPGSAQVFPGASLAELPAGRFCGCRHSAGWLLASRNSKRSREVHQSQMLCSPPPKPSSGGNLTADGFLIGINYPEEPGNSQPRSPGGFGAQGKGQSIIHRQQPPATPAHTPLPSAAPPKERQGCFGWGCPSCSLAVAVRFPVPSPAGEKKELCPGRC